MSTHQRSQIPVYNQVATFRKQRNMDRGDLARALGITPQLLGYIELGTYTPDLALTLRISQQLGVPVEQIFSLRPFHEKGPFLV